MNKSLSCAISAFLLLILAGCNTVDDQQHLKVAKNYLAEGDVKSAIIELKNALQKNPDNSAARVELGTLYQNHGNSIEAEKELRKAQQLGADDNEILPSLGKALLQLRKLDEVLALNAEQLEPSGQGSVLATQGIAHLIRGEHPKAVELTERANDIDPESAYIQVARASTLLLAERSITQARERLKQAFDIDKEYAAAWSLLGDIEAHEKNLEAALDAYTKSIDLQPNNLADRKKRINLYIMLNELEKAQADLDVLKEKFPESPDVAFFQGLIHLASNRLDDAKSAFDLALLAQDRYPITLFYLAYINYQQGNSAQAEVHAGRYFNLNPEHLPNRKLLAELKLERQAFDDAETILKPVLNNDDSDNEVINLFARSLLMRGKTAEGIALLKRVVERNPDSSSARFRLGAGLMVSGNHTAGLEQFESVIMQDKDNHQANIYRILSYLRMGDLEKAHQAAAEFRDIAPESEIPFNMMGMIYIAEKDFKAAQGVLERSWEMRPGNSDAGYNLATIAIQNQEYGKARGYLEEVDKLHPDNLETLLKLAEVDALEGYPQQQLQRLEKAMRLYPGAIKPRLVMAQYYISSGNPDQVTRLIETLDNDAKKQLPVMEIIAKQEIAQKKFTAAEKTARAIIARKPDAPQGYFMLAQAQAGKGDNEKVRETLRKSIEQDANFIPARFVLLRLLLDEGDIPAIEKEIVSLKAIAGESENLLKAEISLEELKGNQPQALKLAERAFEMFPNIGNMLTLSRHKANLGDDEGALALKIDWAEKHPQDYYPNLVVAVSYTRLKQNDLAIPYYQRALTASPESVFVLNNLAWAMRGSQPEQALIYAQKANQLTPDSVPLMDTLAMVYLANKQLDQALNMIKKVLYLEPLNPTFRYHEAMINAEAGNSDQAVRILSDLLDRDKEKHEGFAERVDAVSLLEKLKG